jgi:putative membrane protein
MWWHGPGMGLFGWSLFPGHGVVFVLFWVLVVLAIVGIARGSRRRAALEGPARSSGLDILEERYAKGEIQRDEYLQKKQDLIG